MFPWGVNCRGGMIVLFCSFEMNALFYFSVVFVFHLLPPHPPQKSNTFIRIFLLSRGVLFMFEEGRWSRWHGNRFCLRHIIPIQANKNKIQSPSIYPCSHGWLSSPVVKFVKLIHILPTFIAFIQWQFPRLPPITHHWLLIIFLWFGMATIWILKLNRLDGWQHGEQKIK